EARRPAGRAQGRCRRGRVPRLGGRGDGARPHARRRRRLLAARLMEPTDLNRRVWDEVHRPVERSLPGLPRPVEDRLPDLGGKHVLHLGCGTGEATAELAGLGALVTGVDASAEAVAEARGRAPAVAFVQGDPDQLPVELRRARFDLVYTPIGSELDAWAAGVAAALRRGGELLLHDAHPVLDC